MGEFRSWIRGRRRRLFRRLRGLGVLGDDGIVMTESAHPAFTEGQRVEVCFDKHGWLPGTFEHYTAGGPDEDFRRCVVKMDNGFGCNYPFFHPQCVREIVDD